MAGSSSARAIFSMRENSREVAAAFFETIDDTPQIATPTTMAAPAAPMTFTLWAPMKLATWVQKLTNWSGFLSCLRSMLRATGRR